MESCWILGLILLSLTLVHTNFGGIIPGESEENKALLIINSTFMNGPSTTHTHKIEHVHMLLQDWGIKTITGQSLLSYLSLTVF